MKGDRGLRARRNAIYRSWTQFMSGQTPNGIREEVLSSWCRTRRLLSPDVAIAPVGQSELNHEALLASTRVLDDTMRYPLRDSHVAVAIADLRGQLVWTTGEPRLMRVAEQVNYLPGGLWDEASIGVNAMSLALSCDRPSAVSTAEHWSLVLHDWSCYAAPIRNPQTGQRFGVLNFSTPWDNAHPALYMAVTALAQRLGAEAAANTASDIGCDGIHLSVLGEHRLALAGAPVRVTRRQTEIALLLALRPAGVSLAELHADLYGDEAVQIGTLKAEVSHLRHILDGRVSRTPYRLLGNVKVDALDVLENLRHGRVADAVTGYAGSLLPWSESPRIVRLARTVEVALRDAVLNSNDYESALALATHLDDDAQLADHILRILPSGDGRRHILRGHLTSID
ncbi:transcriptional regulator [Mycobacterium attenuatum]|uniref:transcriptional regulator n=1 Tax=Mycobacterium attenuatum TaxID=2341086 RepID=UPI000F1AAAEA|nr:transcriptional regulator [Mycobacterium attenuatum]VBA57262.1 Acetoin dehydrogenase operon transcriptional activator AcoR [Mycobacterium attenuatum]